jgi:hypothetical protein
MDVKGAKELTERLARRQWRLAPSVQRGEQPSEDPDAEHVESIGDGYRVYALSDEGDGGEVRRVRKVLVDGRWALEDGSDADVGAAA